MIEIATLGSVDSNPRIHYKSHLVNVKIQNGRNRRADYVAHQLGKGLNNENKVLSAVSCQKSRRSIVVWV